MSVCKLTDRACYNLTLNSVSLIDGACIYREEACLAKNSVERTSGASWLVIQASLDEPVGKSEVAPGDTFKS